MTRRSLESRLDDLADDDDSDISIPVAWTDSIPRKLWSSLDQTWLYSLTGGDSHPGLENDPRDNLIE